ncbi:MAG: Uma2 family endonuclease [Planctomycetes bacterium]|nr:Uma2 family endonuclease [Planctomycetota bacterium]
MKWKDVCEDKSLQDLPYKIELNGKGQIVMSPASNRHGRMQSRIGLLIGKQALRGEIISECSVETADGTKVADVAWASYAFIKRHGFETPYTAAPEICVEIASPSNSETEIREKIGLYLDRGAKEVWVCDLEGRVKFHALDGEISKSKLAPKFPSKI